MKNAKYQDTLKSSAVHGILIGQVTQEILLDKSCFILYYITLVLYASVNNAIIASGNGLSRVQKMRHSAQWAKYAVNFPYCYFDWY